MNQYLVDAKDMISVADTIREKANITEQLAFPEGWKDAIRGIKTGVELNFEVVGGTTQPDDPKENTIWVNTDQEITGWSFSATEPETSKSGMVWIKTGDAQYYSFNVCKENELHIRIQYVKQYISGAWIDNNNAFIYQNGAWNNLYNKLDRIEELNATGWARYTEGIAGEYCRMEGRGFTRTSTEPVIWCTAKISEYISFCIIAKSQEALSATSLTTYGDLSISTSIRASGTVYIGCMKYAIGRDNGSYTLHSNGTTYTITVPSSAANYYNGSTLVIGDTLGKWIDELLFGEVR